MTPDLVLLSRVAFRGREIPGARLRGLIALLAGDPRTGCGTGRLIDALWPGEQPENPRKALQILVSRARALLGAEAVARTPTGYRLTLTGDQVDSSAVLIRAAAAARCARDGEHADALTHAEAGLALWSGAASAPASSSVPAHTSAPAPAPTSAPAPASSFAPGSSSASSFVPSSPFEEGFATSTDAGVLLAPGTGSGSDAGDPVAVLRAERSAAYRALTRARALALARLDRHAEARQPLTVLAAALPRDEEVLLELLRCEALTSGPGAALARYEAYRRGLRDDLGADPGPALRAEHRRLLQGVVPAVRRGVGHEPNPMLGRDADLAAVETMLRTSRVTSIVGPGGLGKTRLANAVARRAEFPAVTVVPLAGLAADGDVIAEVAAALGVAETDTPGLPVTGTNTPGPAVAGLETTGLTVGGMETTGLTVGGMETTGFAVPGRTAAIAVAVGSGPHLLVLDNCEHVVTAVAALVRDLVAATADLRVLTTGRTPLGLSSETVHPLPELDLATSAELFAQRARAARPGADLPPDAVAEICRHLDGLPLAIELAAARVRILSVTEIARRLDDRFALLRGGTRDTPRRHHTLHAVVDWSWNLLEAGGRVAMRTLAVFPDGFTVDAARTVLGREPLALLEHLVDHSLLKVYDTPSGSRLRMLETVREFAGAENPDPGPFLRWAREFGTTNHARIFGPDPYPAAAAIRAEQENLLAALRTALAAGDGATVAAVTAVIGGVWLTDSHYARLAGLARQVAWLLSHHRPAPGGTEVTRAALILCVAATFGTEGARPERAVVALRRLGPAPAGSVLGAFARVIGAAGDPAALQRLAGHGEPLVAGTASVLAAYHFEATGDGDAALAAALRALDHFTAQDSPWLRAAAHGRVAELLLQREEGARAREHLLAGLPVLSGLGAAASEAGVRMWLVLANLQTGDTGEAQHWLDGLNRITLDQEAEAGSVGYDLGVRAEMALGRGDVDTGLTLWRRAADRVRDAADLTGTVPLDLEPWVVEARAAAVVAHARHGRLDRVAGIAAALPATIRHVLTHPLRNPPPYLVEQALCGTMLLAVAMTTLAHGDTRTAARLIALAERFRYLRNFQPTMSAATARTEAVKADQAAYEQARTHFATLHPPALRAAALDLLAEIP